MKKIFKWQGSRPENLVCAGLIKDMPILQPWQSIIRISFRFETVYCAMDESRLLTRTGDFVKVTIVYANGKSMIGRDDYLQTAMDLNEDTKAFRSALEQRAIESTLPVA